MVGFESESCCGRWWSRRPSGGRPCGGCPEGEAIPTLYRCNRPRSGSTQHGRRSECNHLPGLPRHSRDHGFKSCFAKAALHGGAGQCMTSAPPSAAQFGGCLWQAWPTPGQITASGGSPTITGSDQIDRHCICGAELGYPFSRGSSALGELSTDSSQAGI